MTIVDIAILSAFSALISVGASTVVGCYFLNKFMKVLEKDSSNMIGMFSEIMAKDGSDDEEGSVH